MRFVIKAERLQDSDGVLTARGMEIASAYANKSLKGTRDIAAEKQFPDLAGVFMDIRGDKSVASDYASSDEVQKSERFVIPAELFFKAGQLFVGKRGGRWADPDHKHSYRDKTDAPAEGKKGGSQLQLDAKKDEPKAKQSSTMAEMGLPESTKAAHSDEQGNYTPNRQALHDNILREMAGHVPSVPHGQKPKALVMVGGPGSGKTTIVNHILGKKHDFVNANSDDVKAKLPEYQQGISHPTHIATDAAQATHAESSDINDKLIDHAMSTRKNLVLDGTGKNKHYTTGMISKLQGMGYSVHAAKPDVTDENAVKRVGERAKTEGRFVTKEATLSAKAHAEHNWPDISRAANSFSLFDNNGSKPELIHSRHNGQEVVHDAKKVADHKQRGSSALDNHARRGLKEPVVKAASWTPPPSKKKSPPPKMQMTPPAKPPLPGQQTPGQKLPQQAGQKPAQMPAAPIPGSASQPKARLPVSPMPKPVPTPPAPTPVATPVPGAIPQPRPGQPGALPVGLPPQQPGVPLSSGNPAPVPPGKFPPKPGAVPQPGQQPGQPPAGAPGGSAPQQIPGQPQQQTGMPGQPPQPGAPNVDPSQWPDSVSDDDLMQRIKDGGDAKPSEGPAKFPGIKIDGSPKQPGVMDVIDEQ